ncbi:MAG: NAD(P)H-hydrate dehydratase [Gammaproteobacteria bacterium]
MSNPRREPLPRALYRAQQVRELDRAAIEDHGIPGLTLMERAGCCAFQVLRERWPHARRMAVFCGLGNNGGDGYVLARLAHAAGLEPTLVQLGDPARIRGDARTMRERLTGVAITVQALQEFQLGQHDLLVDGLLGTGLDRPVEGELAAAIDCIHRSGLPVFALDIPSGLHADTGRVLGTAVRAAATVTFVGLKQGMFTLDGPDHCGALYFDTLGVPEQAYRRVPPSALRVGVSDRRHLLSPRPRHAHKGCFGHVLIVGGNTGYAGAARLAGEAALRSGAGLVSVATRAVHATLLAGARPELMCHPVETREALRALAARADVIAIGPGLGRSRWSNEMLAATLELQRPLVADADALNLLAAEPCRREDWVLTPHPGEAARLLATPIAEINGDRFRAVQALQAQFGGTAILKGNGTLIASGAGPIELCEAGNPGMASGGMGDCLTGIIAALLAQGLSAADAACLGVSLHAESGDLAAAQLGARGLLASDLLGPLQRLVNPSLVTSGDMGSDTL